MVPQEVTYPGEWGEAHRNPFAEDNAIRGDDQQQAALFSSLSPEARVPYDHPLRAIRAMVEAVLKALSPQLDRL